MFNGGTVQGIVGVFDVARLTWKAIRIIEMIADSMRRFHYWQLTKQRE